MNIRPNFEPGSNSKVIVKPRLLPKFLPSQHLLLSLLQPLIHLHLLLPLSKRNQANCYAIWSLLSVVHVMLAPLETSWC